MKEVDSGRKKWVCRGMMKFIEWLSNRFKTDLSAKELVFKVTVDLFLCNLGFFMGILTTVFFKGFTWDTTPQSFYNQMIARVWFANFPLLTFCCLFSFVINRNYRSTRDMSYLNVFLLLIRSLIIAFLIFLTIVYFTHIFLPRSTVVATIFFTFVLILSVRLTWKTFSQKYTITPSKFYNISSEMVARELSVLSQQDGWIPPEKLPAESSWPYFADDEVIAMAGVLRSGKINQWTGKEVEKFQEEFAVVCNVKHAIALANGTAALELALKAIGIVADDEVIVTPRTFIASASCVVLQGAKPIFADVDYESQNVTAATIRKVITPKTKAIIAVHLAGWPCDMNAIMKVANEYNLKVIEDCAQAHGALYKGKPVGSFGHAAAYSFCQDKIMTTGGEGGMLLTNDDKIWSDSWAFKDHGKSYDAVYHRNQQVGFRWFHESFGTNWRMTEMQAAIGRRQLTKLPEWVRIRRRNAAILTESFSRFKAFRVTETPADIFHSYYKYYVFVRPETLKDDWDRDRIMNCISGQGIPCFSGICGEVYLEKAFEGNGIRPLTRLPVAKELGETSLMFLVHPTLSEKDMKKTVQVVEKVMVEATK